MITLTIFEAKKNRCTKLQKLHKPDDPTMKKYYNKIINTKCQLTMHPNKIQKQGIAKFISTNIFDLDKTS